MKYLTLDFESGTSHMQSEPTQEACYGREAGDKGAGNVCSKDIIMPL